VWTPIGGFYLTLILSVYTATRDGDSVLFEIARPIGLAGIAVSVIGLVWCWLAVRWVDRHGKWA
jgi:hypothetical protein